MNNCYNIPHTRSISQQLYNPLLSTPKELVAWMGAIQAQDYNMAKWAIGLRLNGNITDKEIENAFNRGDIIRTHVMRPTWHFVTAENIRWMLKLSAKRIKAINVSYAKDLDVSDKLHLKVNSLLEKILAGNNHQTKQEIESRLNQEGIKTDPRIINRLLMHAEADGVICSGAVKSKKQTYALLEERIPPTKEISKDEALAKLAKVYFQSHSPASLKDFVWWSGLSITEARQAINLIRDKLIANKSIGNDLFIYESYKPISSIESEILHLLPAYDEYLISYTDRTAVLKLEDSPQAYTRYGIFYPVILYNGQIVGNWKKTIKNKQTTLETSFFDSKLKINKDLLIKAEQKYRSFI